MNELTNRAMSLLTQVSALNKKHEEIARITGRKFNVFSILGVESRETSTHSAFLVELLNPKGSHGQGSLFLKLFIKVLEGKKPPSEGEKNEYSDMNVPDNEKVDSATVEKEKYLGSIDKEKTKGGRADIVIRSTTGTICIENKIYADDQENQLIRYHEKYGSNGLILYLTLYGGEASEWSTKLGKKKLEAGEHYFRISYKKDILDWLVKCQSAVMDVPTVRDVIGQYIYLIKKLTGQGMAKEQKNEVFGLITGGDNAEKFIALSNVIFSFLNEIENKLNAVDKRLKHWDYYKSGKVYAGRDKQQDLQSVLIIEMKEICDENRVQLKVRLSPYGWRIELWRTKEIQVATEESDPDSKGILYKTFPFDTKELTVADAVLNAAKDLSQPKINL